MAYYKDGLKQATCIFEAAAWHYGVKAECKCGHSVTFDPHGLWWYFHRRGWSDDLRLACDRMWCVPCSRAKGRKVRPARLTLIRSNDADLVKLPMPDERDWKRAVNRFRG